MGKHSDFKRFKHHQLPGDIGKSEKIAMKERRHPTGRGKTWIQMLVDRTRAVLKCRTQEEISQAQEEAIKQAAASNAAGEAAGESLQTRLERSVEQAKHVEPIYLGSFAGK